MKNWFHINDVLNSAPGSPLPQSSVMKTRADKAIED
jgi:hypothetical protein